MLKFLCQEKFPGIGSGLMSHITFSLKYKITHY